MAHSSDSCCFIRCFTSYTCDLNHRTYCLISYTILQMLWLGNLYFSNFHYHNYNWKSIHFESLIYENSSSHGTGYLFKPGKAVCVSYHTEEVESTAVLVQWPPRILLLRLGSNWNYISQKQIFKSSTMLPRLCQTSSFKILNVVDPVFGDSFSSHYSHINLLQNGVRGTVNVHSLGLLCCWLVETEERGEMWRLSWRDQRWSGSVKWSPEAVSIFSQGSSRACTNCSCVHSSGFRTWIVVSKVRDLIALNPCRGTLYTTQNALFSPTGCPDLSKWSVTKLETPVLPSLKSAWLMSFHAFRWITRRLAHVSGTTDGLELIDHHWGGQQRQFILILTSDYWCSWDLASDCRRGESGFDYAQNSMQILSVAASPLKGRLMSRFLLSTPGVLSVVCV